MKINTERFGEVEVDENLIFDFIIPILGYERLKKYALVDYNPESPFKWLQALDDPKIAFPVTFPGYFGINYEFVIPEEEAKLLELTSSENLLSLNIVCVPQGDPQSSTINLVGPLIINTLTKKAMQLVLINTEYSVKHRLFDGINAFAAKKEEEKVENKS